MSSIASQSAFPSPDRMAAGLSKREYIATQVLAGLAASDIMHQVTNRLANGNGEIALKNFVKMAVEFTDALCEELSEP